MASKPMVRELYSLRALACMSVVLMHALQMIVRFHRTLPLPTKDLMNGLTAVMLFSTPAFAFMSAFLLGYSESKPGALWRKLKYMVVPFVGFAAIYAFWFKFQWGISAWDRFQYFMKGGYHGYFILVVLQVYLVHELFDRWLRQVSPRVMLGAAFVMNLAYLMALNLRWVALPNWGFNWYHLFPAWAFYFALGYYGGRQRDRLLELTRRYRLGMALLAGTALGGVLYMVFSGRLPDLSSQRFDVMLYATGLLLLFFSFAAHMQRVPKLLQVISRFSFSIYLMHWLFQELLWRVSSRYLHYHVSLHVLFIWAGSIVCSVAVAYLLNQLPLGALLVGKLGPMLGPAPAESSQAAGAGAKSAATPV